MTCTMYQQVSADEMRCSWPLKPTPEPPPWTHARRRSSFPLSEEVTLADLPEPSPSVPGFCASFFNSCLEKTRERNKDAAHARILSMHKVRAKKSSPWSRVPVEAGKLDQPGREPDGVERSTGAARRTSVETGDDDGGAGPVLARAAAAVARSWHWWTGSSSVEDDKSSEEAVPGGDDEGDELEEDTEVEPFTTFEEV
jgi:hypothetical protein